MKRAKRNNHRAAAAAAAFIVSMVCASSAPAYQFSRKEIKELVWSPGRRIVVEETAGDIEVRAGDGDRVKIVGTLTVEAKTLEEARAESRSLRMEVTSARGEIRVTAKRPRGRPGAKSRIDFSLIVPADAPLVLKTVSGGVRVTGAEGEVVIGSVAGSVRVRDSYGPIEARTVSGGVRIENCSGDALAETVGGEIVYDTEETDADAVALRSTGGSITASLPADFSAVVQVVTISGDIRSELPLKTTGKEKNILKGILGAGGAELKINTISGDITLKQAAGGNGQ